MLAICDLAVPLEGSATFKTDYPDFSCAMITAMAIDSYWRTRTVNADSIFPTCAEVKFPSWRVPMISRLGDRLLQFLVADRGGAAVVPGLAR